MSASIEIYLDYNATTPCDPRVVEKMLPYFYQSYGNPSNGYHSQGRGSAKAIDTAREQVASLISAYANEIVFTAGATESDNLAIFGIARKNSKGRRKRIITSRIEHKAVLNPFYKLVSEGFESRFVDVDSNGQVSIEQLRKLIDANTLFVSIQLANNEIGTIEPVKDIAALAHQYGVIVHCDAAQAIGKISVDVNDLGVDLMSISSHKFYGPKGIGALYIRGGASKSPLEPIFYGGGQEKDVRPGTLNVPGIIGFGEAANISQSELHVEAERILVLRNILEQTLVSEIPTIQIHARDGFRLPNTCSFACPSVDADALLLNLPDVMMGTGSACNSGAIEPSHVLQAMGVSRDLSHQTIRASLGRFTTQEQIQTAAKQIVAAYRNISG